MKTLADLLKVEVRRLEDKTGHIAYLSYPYSCCLTEAMVHTKQFECPPAGRLQIEHEDKRTTINIKPIKGSGRRKPFAIRIWT